MARVLSLYRDYLNELARFDPDIDTMAEPTKDWLRKPDQLIPYGIERDGELIGFLLVTGRTYAEAMGEDCDAYLHAFFVAPQARTGGTAESAALEMISLHTGPGPCRSWLAISAP